MAGEDTAGGGERIPEADRVTLISEDGSERDYVLLAVVDVEEQDYALLTPESQLTEEEEPDEAVLELHILQYDVDKEGQELFSPVAEDSTYEMLKGIFSELLEEAEPPDEE